MDINQPCVCCGALSIPTAVADSMLFALCDMLVIKALEVTGKRIVRSNRARYNGKGDTPWHECHSLWRPDGMMTDKGLENAWDLVPVMLAGHGLRQVTPQQVVGMLDRYARDLLITGVKHNQVDLRYRFEKVLSIRIPAHQGV
jgi:hypothetical protein